MLKHNVVTVSRPFIDLVNRPSFKMGCVIQTSDLRKLHTGLSVN